MLGVFKEKQWSLQKGGYPLKYGFIIKFKSLSTHYCMETGGTRFE